MILSDLNHLKPISEDNRITGGSSASTYTDIFVEKQEEFVVASALADAYAVGNYTNTTVNTRLLLDTPDISAYANATSLALSDGGLSLSNSTSKLLSKENSSGSFVLKSKRTTSKEIAL